MLRKNLKDFCGSNIIYDKNFIHNPKNYLVCFTKIKWAVKNAIKKLKGDVEIDKTYV